MFPDFLVGPLVALAILSAALWRTAATITRSHHWPAWYPLAMVVVIALLFAVVALLAELAREVQARRIHMEKILVQQRYPYCHVTRLSSGQWFLTDKITGREYRPEWELVIVRDINNDRPIAPTITLGIARGTRQKRRG